MKLKFFYTDGSTYVANKVTWWLDVPEENAVLYRSECMIDGAVSVNKFVKIKRNELLAVIEKTPSGFVFAKINKNVYFPAVAAIAFFSKEENGDKVINLSTLRF